MLHDAFALGASRRRLSGDARRGLRRHRPGRRGDAARSSRSARSRSTGSALFASARSAGRRSASAATSSSVEDAATPTSRARHRPVAAGKATSRALAPKSPRPARSSSTTPRRGAMDPDVPLVVPEVNGEALALDPEGDRRQPELHDDGGDAGAEAAARRGRARGDRRRHLPGGLGLRARRRRRARRAARPQAEGAAALTFDGGAVELAAHEKFPAPIAYNVIPLAGSIVDDGRSRPTRSRSTATSAARSSGSRSCASPAPACGCRSSPATARRSPRRSTGRSVAEEATELLARRAGRRAARRPDAAGGRRPRPEPRRAAPARPTPCRTACRCSSSATTCARARRSTPCRSPRRCAAA